MKRKILSFAAAIILLCGLSGCQSGMSIGSNSEHPQSADFWKTWVGMRSGEQKKLIKSYATENRSASGLEFKFKKGSHNYDLEKAIYLKLMDGEFENDIFLYDRLSEYDGRVEDLRPFFYWDEDEKEKFFNRNMKGTLLYKQNLRKLFKTSEDWKRHLANRIDVIKWCMDEENSAKGYFTAYLVQYQIRYSDNTHHYALCRITDWDNSSLSEAKRLDSADSYDELTKM